MWSECIPEYAPTELSHILIWHSIITPCKSIYEKGAINATPKQGLGVCRGSHSWQIEGSFQCWAVSWVTDSIQWEFGTFVFFSLLSSSLIFLIQSNKVYFWLYSVSKFVLLWIWRIGHMKGRGHIFYHYYRECLFLSSPAAVFCRCSCITQILGEKEQQASSVRVQFLLLYSSARLQPIGQIQLFQDNCGGWYCFR